MTKIIVIGAGPGGYETAIRAAQLGAEVTVVEKEAAGGCCLNTGCIPTKTLWKIAEVMEDLERRAEFGIVADNIGIDGKKVKARKDYVVERMNKGVEFLFNSYSNINYVKGTASLKDNKTIIVESSEGTQEFSADHIILATGASPIIPPFEGATLEGVLTSTDLLNIEEVPKSLVVVGTGVIGMEFASIYATFGSKVTVVGGDVLGGCDKEVSKRAQSLLSVKGIKFIKGVRAEKIEKTENGLKVIAKKPNNDKIFEAEGEKVLMAIGRKPFAEGLNLEEVGVELNRGGIVVDDDFKTNIEGIYAIGDCVAGNIQLAHVASSQGISLVERLMGEIPHTVMDIVPAAVFTLPEIAQVGKTEEQLKEEGIEFEKSKFLFSGNGKAVSMGATDGFVKVLATKDLKKILGVHVLGPHANDLVHIGTVAMVNGLSVADMSKMIYAHPTVSEALMETFHGFEGASIHTPHK